MPTGKSILVVDDDDANRDSLALLLDVQGYEVAVARSGQDALERLRSGPLPDLILLDLLMPGMNGWEFRERQRRDARIASVPVVVISAVGEVAQWQDLLGDVAYIQKPIIVDQLQGAIRRFTTPSKPEVLVAEDEAAIRSLLDMILRHYGFVVRLAANGREAVDLYRRHHRSITVVLLDVQMPILDGPHALAAIKEIDPEVRCCFMSGHTGRYSTEGLLGLGASHILQKPFVSTSVVARVLWDLSSR